MFIRWMEAHARRGWFIGDLHRHWLPYYGFGLLAWIMRWHQFVLSDGRISIARSFVTADWRQLVQAAGLSETRCRSPGICRSALFGATLPAPLIIGGGPAGAAAAIVLAQAGRRVTLIERNAGPPTKCVAISSAAEAIATMRSWAFACAGCRADHVVAAGAWQSPGHRAAAVSRVWCHATRVG